MTFDERCERFVKNSAKEHNRYRFVYRVIFLNKKIEEHEKEELEPHIQNKRAGDLLKYKKMIQ